MKKKSYGKAIFGIFFVTGNIKATIESRFSVYNFSEKYTGTWPAHRQLQLICDAMIYSRNVDIELCFELGDILIELQSSTYVNGSSAKFCQKSCLWKSQNAKQLHTENPLKLNKSQVSC